METTNGYDIGPGEERTMVDVLVGFSSEPGAEGEPVYQQHYLNRPAHRRFYEPLDLSDQDSSSVDAHPYQSFPQGTNNVNNRAEHQRFHSERERLKTFDGVWSSDYNVTKEDLAREGFIYKGPGDLVMCVFCLKSIRRWDPGDSVEGEHKRLYPRCPWVGGKVNHMNIPMSETINMQREMRVVEKGQPHFSDMATTEARLNSFQGWIKRNNVSVDNLVKEGFFYDSTNDVVTCFHCGITIHGWDLYRDVTSHHAQTSPDCPMVQRHNSAGQRSQSATVMDVTISQGQEEEGQRSAESEPLQGEMTNIDEDMQSAAVQAIVVSYGDDYSMEEIRNAVKALRITKGDSRRISSEEILKELDPDLDS